LLLECLLPWTLPVCLSQLKLPLLVQLLLQAVMALQLQLLHAVMALQLLLARPLQLLMMLLLLLTLMLQPQPLLLLRLAVLSEHLPQGCWWPWRQLAQDRAPRGTPGLHVRGLAQASVHGECLC